MGQLHGCPREEIQRLKQKRRTLKNRGYAQNCRTKRLAQRHELETRNRQLQQDLQRLRVEYDRVVQERDYYREQYQRVMASQSVTQLNSMTQPPSVHHERVVVSTTTPNGNLANGGGGNSHGRDSISSTNSSGSSAGSSPGSPEYCY